MKVFTTSVDIYFLLKWKAYYIYVYAYILDNIISFLYYKKIEKSKKKYIHYILSYFFVSLNISI